MTPASSPRAASVGKDHSQAQAWNRHDGFVFYLSGGTKQEGTALASPRPHPTPPARWLPPRLSPVRPRHGADWRFDRPDCHFYPLPELQPRRAALSVCHKLFQLEMQPARL